MLALIGLEGPSVLPKKARTAGVLIAGYLAALWFCLSFTPPDHVPLFWLGNAFVAAMVVMLSGGPLLRPALILALICSYPICRHFTSGFPSAASRMAINYGEGLLCGWLALKILGPRRLLRSSMGFLKLQLLAVLPAAVADALGNLIMREVSQRFLGDVSLAGSWRTAMLPHPAGHGDHPAGAPAAVPAAAFRPAALLDRDGPDRRRPGGPDPPGVQHLRLPHRLPDQPAAADGGFSPRTRADRCSATWPWRWCACRPPSRAAAPSGSIRNGTVTPAPWSIRP
ncbi:MAG: hypothetical protein WDN45_01560 [Caulobacteraceae bacterium]